MLCRCGGTIQTYESRGHEKAGCSRCHRCVPFSELLAMADVPSAESYRAGVSAWFREVAALEDRYREHLQVKLTAEQCLEVARIVDAGITMYACDVDETLGMSETEAAAR